MRAASPPIESLSSRSGHWLARCSVLFGLLLLLLSNNLENLHALFAPHVYCDVHAQLEHRASDTPLQLLGAAELLDPTGAGSAADCPDLEERSARLAELIEDEHNSCDLILTAARLARLVQPREPGAEAEWRLTNATYPALVPRAERIARLRLAPKNSPPKS